MDKEKREKKPVSFNDLSSGQIKKILNEEAKSNKAIDQELKVAAMELRREVSLLLLGSGEAGKSTILKQLRVLHDSGFSAEEKKRYVTIVRRNVVAGLKEVLQQAFFAGFGADFGPHKALAEDLAEIDDKVDFESVLPDIKLLLETTPVKSILSQVSRYQIPDATPAFLSSLSRIEQADYEPTTQDMLLSRVRTTSISEYQFQIENTPFRFIDVAGQRSERRKWIHFFDGVTAMIFVASLSSYNQSLREDPSVNAMHDQLQLFDEMVNSRWFKDTNVILFLNKRDLFEEKITDVPIDGCFPDYVYGETELSRAAHAMDYINLQFLKLKRSDKVVYSHFTCATNSDNIAVVFRAVRDTIFRNILRHD